ncbi:Co/Zn/Cd efflux system component [Methylohalomonas lacus]|uniref:Co/Zn/Cd efflux system component n=1 Tax=Methylohalomonas lacus TaxID=398773 RepID=A0AAE3HMY2_9GAMM|nr:cation transporter [Methylohalomonas lacus]MCS3904109.1 Co/Zn/Cd efflux system component [Methylohalomonas lacus]
MSDCCHNTDDLKQLQQRQSGTLRIVLVINAVMFMVILTAALYADSSALLSDSLDNLGDALTYAFSLYAVSLGMRSKARVALFKGMLILLAALAVWGQIIYRLIEPSVPVFELMGLFSVVALIANSTCLALLWRHRGDDVNMSSVWECSRNDIVANVSVFVAAGAVWLTEAAWPDLLVAICLASFFLRSSIRVLASARSELREA